MLDDYDIEDHEAALLAVAARTCDRLQDLADALVGQPLIVPGIKGDQANPLLVEQRMQAIVLSRLLASLRLPSGDEEADGRPQRRGSARGSYAPRAVR